MNYYSLGYIFVFFCLLGQQVSKSNARGGIGRRRKALAPTRQHFYVNNWGFLSTLSPEPEFMGDIPRIKVIAGKDAILTCGVENLGDYKVTWSVVNKKDQLSIGTHVFIDKDRIKVTTINSTSWYLHIKNVTQHDDGYYACQITTNPIKSQTGYLEVVEPPEFVTDMANRNVTVMENSNVTLSCRATGKPPPVIKWKREDGQPFSVGNELVREYISEELNLTSISRNHMAAYLCLASNEVPPAISRRIYLDVKFPPLIWIQNQLVGVRENADAHLECHTEAHPTSINSWMKDEEPVETKSSRYHTHITRNTFKTVMKLTIKSVQPGDYGYYHCVAKNAISETRGSIKVIRLNLPTSSPRKPVTEEMPVFPTRRVITVAATTEYRTLVTEIERWDTANAPGTQQKYGLDGDSNDEKSGASYLETHSIKLLLLLLCILTKLHDYPR
ncbi:lachesin [Parasteatoda tepidariorum]|uniref:lachesin n=1 Tax=Parasteatoda tepidariorum TaxID=114398 RepID=UPI00077F99C1|nr:lachesin [Parasteatoda tepidariorum]